MSAAPDRDIEPGDDPGRDIDELFGAEAVVAHRAGADGTPLVDQELEVAAVGSMLIVEQVERRRAMREVVRSTDFYNTACRTVWESLIDVDEIHGATDVVMLRAELLARGAFERIGGAQFLARLMAAAPTGANAEILVRQVAVLGAARAIVAAGELVSRARGGRDLERALEALHEAEARRLSMSQAAVSPFRIVGAGQLLETRLDPVRWLVGNGLVRRRGITTMTASAKRGKTCAGLDLGLALIRRCIFPGDDTLTWLGAPVLDGGPVVMVSGEGGLELMRERVRRAEPTLAVGDLDLLRILAERPLPRLDEPSSRRAFFAELRRSEACAAIIDPLSRFWSIEDENAAGPMTQLFGALRGEAEDANVALILAHHDARPGPDGGDSPTGGRGSSVLANEPDCLIRMRPHDAEDPLASRVYFLGRWGTPDPCIVRITEGTGRVAYVGPLGPRRGRSAPSGAAVQTVSDDDLIRALKRCGDWVPIAAWCAAAELSRTQLLERARKLYTDGLIERRTGQANRLEYRATVSDVDRPTGERA